VAALLALDEVLKLVEAVASLRVEEVPKLPSHVADGGDSVLAG